MATLGKDILVIADGQVICGTKANSIQCDCETVEIASASDNGWVHRIAGRKSWSVTVNCLIVPATSGNKAISIKNLLSVGSSYTLRIKPRNGSASESVQGAAILKTMELNAVIGGLATGSWKFEGNGPLVEPTT